jgi:Ca-activated chloride channel family protein
VPSLETDMMPAQGSSLSKALAKTLSLFSQAGIINGNILVITDDIHQRDEIAIKKIVAQGHRLSVFGIGTTAGAPVPLDGGFLQNSEGAIVIPKLYPAKLQSYALTGGGLYSSLQADDSDIDKFTTLFLSTEISKDIDSKNLNADVWQEEGHWLLLPVIFFAALWARKGWLATLLLFVFSFVAPITQPAYADSASTQSNYLDTENLWSRPDQKAMKAFNIGDNKKAAEKFTQTEWKASALYRNGDYEAAAKTLENTNNGDGYYNRGNALARLGKFEEAIKAYDKALELNESNNDASYNREQVKQALKKQQQENQQQDSQKQEGEKQQQDDQSQESQQQDNQPQEQDSEQQGDPQQKSQQSDNQSSEQSEDESNDESNKNQQQQPSSKSDSQEQQQKEQEQLKQRDAKAESEQQKQEEQQYQQDQKENQDETQQQNPDTADKEVEHKDSEEKPMDIEVNPMEASITEDEKATEQWLKRIPDDPGGLLRRKFYYQYKKIPNQRNDNEPW